MSFVVESFVPSPFLHLFLLEICVSAMYPDDADVTFVLCVFGSGLGAAHEHWASQSSLCGLGHFPYDFVGKFERVETDAPFLLKAMGRGGEKFPTQDDLHYKSSGAEKLFSTFYTPSLETLLREKFQSDVTLLEYS